MNWQHSLAWGALGLAWVAIGCSEDDTTPVPTTTATAQGGTGGSTGGTGGQGAAAGQGGAGAEGGGGATGGTGGQAGQGGQGGQGGSAVAPMDVSLNGWQMWLNCMPTVPPDPLNGFFNATYDNSAGTAPASATITSAKVILSDGTNSLEWTFTVTPNSAGPVPTGVSTLTIHNKDASSGSGTGTGAPCGYCGNTDTMTLEVEWDVEGVTVTDTLGPMTGHCVT